MKLRIKQMKQAPGRAFPVEGELEVERIERRGITAAYKTRISYRGEARYWPERFHLELEWEAEVERECARCLRHFTVHLRGHDQIMLCEERHFQLDQDLYPFENDVEELDLGPFAQSLVVERLDPKPLCKPDCRGLCPHCGADLNVEEHHPGCPALQEREVDPRLAVLKDLL